ncbi:lycopene cyclase family protein [Nocardia pseudobrasiliensis]|uniref:Lycopene beta-cyclase n=1 Tax=Nocardia pseudobrasiliensis TaxID=45979 RepID=A0A370IAQ0_9NOCA|nr:lycopene cyclase family protein [Nocardia pseudobrasiliensis]RDI67211.1 lycopene beta-cyclase [Nocardia pseudobrasiliensis]
MTDHEPQIWSNSGVTTDLIVCGLGPAGRALAHRALAQGFSVTVVDPHPDRRWTATYGGWADELPHWLDRRVLAATVERPIAWGTRRFEIDRRYVVFDTAALRDSLTLDAARVIAARATAIEHGSFRMKRPARVHLSSGEILTARRAIDARGISRSPAHAEQTAYGVVVPETIWNEPLFMDWRPDSGAAPDQTPSFLYAIPLGHNRFLLEETCLAGRPALPLSTLRTRLHHRLHTRGITLQGTEPTEHVRFPLQGGHPSPHRFGAAAAMLHPATGYSLTTSLATADTLTGPTGKTIHLLRTAGLRSLLALPPTTLPAFFDIFFTLPPHHQRAYLSSTNPRTTATAMLALFTALPWPLRRTLATATLGLHSPNRTPDRK